MQGLHPTLSAAYLMKSGPILVYGVEPDENDLRLKLLIELLGLTCTTITADKLDEELNRAPDHGLCSMVSAATIHCWCRAHSEPAIALEKLRQKSSELFIYGFSSEQGGVTLAARLSDGAIFNVQRFARSDLRYEVSSSHPEITREFSGLSLGTVRRDVDYGFLCSANPCGVVSLISVAGMPLWALVRKDGCATFLLACSAIADIREKIGRMLDVDAYFSQLLPAAMFLRGAFGNRCWHVSQHLASFIVDDPPLKRSYGYLNFAELVPIMDKHNFATTIAFIPWNHRRTAPAVTGLFRERPDKLSICVHGCDHSAGEFATRDLALSNSKVRLASKRMENLRQDTGLAYSKVMVFPQARFSVEALTALKSNNYLAAVNSSLIPEYSHSAITVGDCLDPAVTAFGGCPLFVRHYPNRLEQFALDLFFGKPALIVEHQSYFKDYGKRLVEFIARLNSLARLHWAGLHDVITRNYLERDAPTGNTVCKLFTNNQLIENRTGRERRFVITKSENGDVPIQDVFVNGEPAAFASSGGLINFTITIPPHTAATVNIVYQNILPCAEPRRAFAGHARIWARRMVSEFRDNVLCRSDVLFASAQALNRRLFGSPRLPF